MPNILSQFSMILCCRPLVKVYYFMQILMCLHITRILSKNVRVRWRKSISTWMWNISMEFIFACIISMLLLPFPSVYLYHHRHIMPFKNEWYVIEITATNEDGKRKEMSKKEISHIAWKGRSISSDIIIKMLKHKCVTNVSNLFAWDGNGSLFFFVCWNQFSIRSCIHIWGMKNEKEMKIGNSIHISCHFLPA